MPDLTKLIVDVGGPDPIGELGALKIFHLLENDVAERDKAIQRLKEEMAVRAPNLFTAGDFDTYGTRRRAREQRLSKARQDTETLC
jgi:hypothetical protein